MDQKKAPRFLGALIAFTYTADLLQDYLHAGMLLSETKEPCGSGTILATRYLFNRQL